MSKPVDEQIAEEIVSRLSAVVVTVDAQTLLAEVYRVNRDASDWTPENNSIVVKQTTATRFPEMDCPGNPPAVAYQLEFALVSFTRQPDREENADEAAINMFAALVRKAITNGSDWYTFGGLAFDAEVGEIVPFITENGAHAGAVQQLMVRFKVSELDPFVVR